MTTAVVNVNASTGEVDTHPPSPAEQAQIDKDRADTALFEKAQADKRAVAAKAEQDWRAAVEAATTLGQVKAALLGTGLPAQADVRPNGR